MDENTSCMDGAANTSAIIRILLIHPGHLLFGLGSNENGLYSVVSLLRLNYFFSSWPVSDHKGRWNILVLLPRAALAPLKGTLHWYVV